MLFSSMEGKDSEPKVELLTTVSTGKCERHPPKVRVAIGPEVVGRYIESQLTRKDGSKRVMAEAKARRERESGEVAAASSGGEPFIDNMLSSMRMAVRKPPEVPLGKYLARFRGFYPPEYGRTVWVVTALYFARIQALPGFHLFRGNAHFVALMALTLALKYLLDNCPHGIYFALVGGISFEEHRHLEGLVLRLLDFRLYFDRVAFCCMLRSLEAFDASRAATTATTAAAAGRRECEGGEGGESKDGGKAVGKKMIEFFKGTMCCMSNHGETN